MFSKDAAPKKSNQSMWLPPHLNKTLKMVSQSMAACFFFLALDFTALILSHDYQQQSKVEILPNKTKDPWSENAEQILTLIIRFLTFLTIGPLDSNYLQYSSFLGGIYCKFILLPFTIHTPDKQEYW